MRILTAPALPPEVERALVAAIDAVDDAANGHITNAQSCAAEDALRTAIARALGGDGEPVAWQIVDVKDGPTGYVGVTEDSAWARMEKATWCSRAEWAKERHARPLYEHPASDASARVDEAHRALGKPGRVDDDGCCTGCGRSVQPSPCCPDFPVWPGPCRSCYAYDAATGDTGEGDCPHHSETGLGGCGRFAWHCDGCGRIRWIYDASKGIGSRADVPRGVVLEGPPTTAVEIARRMLTLGDVALLLERAGSSDDEQGSARRTLLRLEALRNALAAEATRAATGDHPSEARRGHESEGLGGPDAR